MKKFDVMHIITSLGDGGAEGVLFRLVVSTKKDYNHTVICLGPKEKYFYKFKKEKIQVNCLDLNIFNFIKNIFVIFLLIKKFQPTNVQTWLYHSDLLGGLVAKICGIKNIFWNIRTSEIKFKNTKITTLVTIFFCSILSHFVPTKIVSCSARATTIHKKIGYKNIFINIDNGFEISQNKIACNPQEGDVIKNIFLIGMVARYHSVKNHNLLFKAISLLSKKIDNFKVILIGAGINNRNKKLITCIKNYNLTKKIILKGRVDKVSKYFGLMDIHILPSHSEGFPNVVAESMLNKTPCIVTDVGESKKIIGKLGKITSSTDATMLQKNIMYFYNLKNTNKAKWNSLREDCYKHINKKFSLEKMVRGYKSVWRN